MFREFGEDLVQNLYLKVLHFIVSVCWATTFFPQPFPEAVKNAPVIVRGTVGMNYTDWGKDPEGTQRIYTYYEVQLAEGFKGNIPNQNSMIIRELGGEKDGVGLHVAGTSQYHRGEDVVVFLRDRNADNSYDVQGMMMGKYNVQIDSSGQEVLSGPGLIENNGPGNHPKWTLEALRGLIQTQKGAASPSLTDQKTKTTPSESLLHQTDPTRNPPSPTAPQLQRTAPEEPSRPFIVFGILFGGIIVILRLLRRKK
jgi:hypothetical protein